MHYTQRKQNLFVRAKILQAIRSFFDKSGFLEIETPLLIPANAPEEYIDPISVRSKSLQTSPELCMKRLICRGYDKIFQISHCWRDGERGLKHLPEFTMLEWYRANSDYRDLMLDCKNLLRYLEPFRTSQSKVSFTNEIKMLSVRDAFNMFTSKSMEESLADNTFDELMVTTIETSVNLEFPVFLYDYPPEKASLARLKSSDITVAERFEFYLGGVELANGFSELNDAKEQKKRFIAANEVRRKRGAKKLKLPDKYLNELNSMPLTSGIALGIDRLIMLATGTDRIDDVVAFTPEEL